MADKKQTKSRLEEMAHKNYSGVAMVPGLERDYQVATNCFKAGAPT